MKKNKLALLASMGLASLVFLSGCVSVDRKTGNPTGLIWNLLGRPMGEAIKFFANNLGLGFGIGIIIVTLIVRLIILPPVSYTHLIGICSGIKAVGLL